MIYYRPFLLAALCAAGISLAADDPVVFRSSVSLVHVDAQVVDRDNRTITGLTVEDFVLSEEGKPQPIRNFASENMPLDVLLLLDVSGSMRPHVERIANAAQEALRVLADHDRVGIMVFDTYTRVRLPFSSDRDEINRQLQKLLRQERFNGGTHITNALLDAAAYVQREGRKEARRAIVILTDDESQDERNDERVERALTRADAVLSFLQAPDAMSQRRGGMGGHHGGAWPGGGGGWPGGPVVLGRRGGYGSPGGGYERSHSAGSADIARDSGGDTFSVDNASALEDTLSRLRQRYGLYFNLAEGTKPGEQRSIQVDLVQAARRRYPDAEVRFRRVYLAPGGSDKAGPTLITHGNTSPYDSNASRTTPDAEVPGDVASKRHRRAVDESSPSPSVSVGPDPQ